MKPFVVLGRSRPGIDFDALDNKPTHLAFVLGLKYAELHLPWLAKLVQILATNHVAPAVLTAATAEEMYRLLAESEHELAPALGAGA